MFHINAKANVTEIDIFGDIGENWFGDGHTMQSVKDQIRDIKGNIVVNLSSLGGSVNDGLAIHDILKSHNGDVKVKIIGATASSGTVVAMSGSSVEMSENALFLVHNAWTYTVGNADELRKQAENLDQFDNRLIAIYVAKTGKTEDEVRALMADEKWIDASEAKDWGFVDSVFEPMKAAAHIDKKKLANAGLPELPKNYYQMENTDKTLTEKILAAVGIKTDEALKAENAELKTQIEALKPLEGISAKFDSVSGELDAAKAKVTEAEQRVSEIEGKLNTANTEIQAKATEITALTEEVERLKAGQGSGGNGGSDPRNPHGREELSEGQKILAAIWGEIPETEKALHAKTK